MTPKISICIPTHNMKNKDFFLKRALDSVRSQTFQDYEIVVTEDGKMAENTNSAIRKAEGELVKVLYMDDWLAHPRALELMVYAFDSSPMTEWLIASATTNPHPKLTKDLETGNNKLGSPSALMFRNHFKNNILFDERMSWLLDCDLYKRMLDKYGFNSLFIIDEQLVDSPLIGIGIHDGQMTNILTDKEKLSEHNLIRKKYA